MMYNMYDYSLQIAGLHTLLKTPYRITVTDRLRPFLCSYSPDPDCVITLQLYDRLPEPDVTGIWHGLSCYTRSSIFHCREVNGKAFAVTRFGDNGNIDLDVLNGYAHFFTGTSGIFNRIGMEKLLLQHQGLLLHASFIKYTENGILFSGPSGVGKSTQAELWHTCLQAQIINGDRAALRKTADGWMAYGSSYAGTSGIYCNEHAPVRGIVILRQAEENRLTQMLPVQALRHLYPELSVHHWDRFFTAAATDLCLDLIAHVPVFLLECRPDVGAVMLLKEGLSL